MGSRKHVHNATICDKCGIGSVFTGDMTKYNPKSRYDGKSICPDCAVREIIEWHTRPDTPSGNSTLKDVE